MYDSQTQSSVHVRVTDWHWQQQCSQYYAFTMKVKRTSSEPRLTYIISMLASIPVPCQLLIVRCRYLTQ